MGQGARTRTTELNEFCTWGCKFFALEPCSLTQTLRSRLLDLVGFDSGSTHPQASWKSRAVLYFVTSRSPCGYDDFSTSMNLPLNFFMVLSISICILQLTCQTDYISDERLFIHQAMFSGHLAYSIGIGIAHPFIERMALPKVEHAVNRCPS